jgi:chromosome segregation ATPase
MALFGSSRPRAAGRGPAAGDGGTRPAAAPVRPGAAGGPGLKESLEQLYALRPAREVFADEAIKLIVKASGAKAAALLGYEQRNDRLRLLASVGLEGDALAVLAGDSVRSSWDIPLRGLRNRRINVMEAAQDNPFVPKPLLNLSPRQLSIAALPFYHASLPVGSVVLIAASQRGFPDGLLQLLSQALRVCAMALAALPSAAGAPVGREEPAVREQPTLLRGVATLKAELARLAQALEEAERQRAAEAAERVTAESFLQAQRERVVSLEKELAELRSAQGRLPTLEDEVRGLQEQLQQAQAAAAAAASEGAQLRAALSEAERRAAEGAATIEALAAARDELHESAVAQRDELERRLEVALADVRERTEALAQLEARWREVGERAEQADGLRRSLQAAEEARGQAERDLARLREELAGAADERARGEAALRQASENLAAAQAEARSLGAQLAEAQAKVKQLEVTQQALSTLRQQLEAAEAARQALQRELETVRAAQTDATRSQEVATREWTARFAAVEAERNRVSEELARLRTESGSTVGQLQEQLEAAARERRELAERLETLTQAAVERDRLQARVEEIEAELGGARETGHALEARVKELGEVSARLISERRELHAQIESLTAGGQTREQEKQAAINAAQQRVTELESALSRMAKALDASRAAAAEELSRTRAEAERDQKALREELDANVAAQKKLANELAQRTQQAGAQEKDAQKLATEGQRLRGELEQLQRQHAEVAQRLETATRELDRVRQDQQEREREVAALERELGEARTARDTLTAQLHQTQEQLMADASARLAAAEAARRELETTLATERQARTTEVAALNAELRRVRDEVSAQLAEMSQRHQAAEREHLAERERLTQALAEKEALLQTVEEGLTTIEMPAGEAEFEIESELTIDRSIADEAAAAAEAAPTPAAEGPRSVLIVDDGDLGADTAQRLAQLGYQATAVPPAPDVASRLGTAKVTCAAINLAVPAAWAAVRALRNGPQAPVPLIAYAMAAGAKTGFWFGAADFLVLPLAEGNVTAALTRMVPKLRRTIAMSSDIDVMGAVRTQLNSAKVSTAVVLDGRQALDLLPTVRPEAAILHLSPTCTDVFRAIAGFRSAEISRDIPILFLLDATAQQREEAFLSAGVRMLSGRGNLKADDLVSTLADALAAVRG